MVFAAGTVAVVCLGGLYANVFMTKAKVLALSKIMINLNRAQKSSFELDQILFKYQRQEMSHKVITYFN